MTRPLRIAFVNTLTLLGCALGLAGVYLLPDPRAAPLLTLSLIIDAIDGYFARKIDACTTFGARFDWCVDTCMSYAIVYRFAPEHPIYATALAGALIATQTIALAYAKRFSGRAIVTALAICQLVLSQRIDMNAITGHIDSCTCAECTATQFNHGLSSPPPSTGQMIESLLTEQYQGNGDTPTAAPPLGIPDTGHIASDPMTIPSGCVRLVTLPDHRDYVSTLNPVTINDITMNDHFNVIAIFVGSKECLRDHPHARASGIYLNMPSDAFCPALSAFRTSSPTSDFPRLNPGDRVHLMIENPNATDMTFLSSLHITY